jgi:hypothetical protein
MKGTQMKTLLLLITLLLAGCKTTDIELPDGTRITITKPQLFGEQYEVISASKQDSDFTFDVKNYKSESAGDITGKALEGFARGLKQ